MPFEPLFTKKQLEDRLSATVVRRIYDDNNDGTADTDPIEQLRLDASSKVRGKLGPVYNPELLLGALADELVRIGLDQAVAMAAQRFPEVMRKDWEKLMTQADKDLSELRKGIANLGVNTSPEPAANVGGEVIADDQLLEDEPQQFWTGDGGTGIF